MNISWQLADHEAARARFQFVEAEHILIGICSLDKVISLDEKDSGLTHRIIYHCIRNIKEWQFVFKDEGIEIIPC